MCLWCFYFRELLFHKSSFPDKVGAEVAEWFTLYMQRKISTNRVGKIYKSFLQELRKVMTFLSPFDSKNFAVNNIALVQSWDI